MTISAYDAPVFGAIARHFDEPFGDASAVPTYALAQLARDYVTVALTRDAGDELFAGYDDYGQGLKIWGKPMPPGGSLWEKIRGMRYRRLGLGEGYALMGRRINASLRRCLYTPAFRGQVSSANAVKSRARWADRVKDRNPLYQMQYTDLMTYLPCDILVKVDRMSMAHGLECRSPLLDYRIVDGRRACRLGRRSIVAAAENTSCVNYWRVTCRKRYGIGRKPGLRRRGNIGARAPLSRRYAKIGGP